MSRYGGMAALRASIAAEVKYARGELADQEYQDLLGHALELVGEDVVEVLTAYFTATLMSAEEISATAVSDQMMEDTIDKAFSFARRASALRL